MTRPEITCHEQELLLASVMHHLTPEIRRKVMREVPRAYNAWAGRQVVRVTFAVTGREVTP